MPPNPPSNAHGFAMRSMSLRDMQIPKSEKKISWPPPPPKSWGRPCNKLIVHRIGMYKFNNGFLPEVLNAMYRKNSEIHSYTCNTRNKDMF